MEGNDDIKVKENLEQLIEEYGNLSTSSEISLNLSDTIPVELDAETLDLHEEDYRGKAHLRYKAEIIGEDFFRELSIKLPSVGVFEGGGKRRGLHANFNEVRYSDGSKDVKKVVSTKRYDINDEEAEKWFYENLADEVSRYLPDSISEMMERG